MKKLPWRSAFYLAVLTWLVLDLKCCNGPLKRQISETRPSSAITQEKARRLGWVALVNQEPVTQKQLELAVSRHLYQRSKNVENVNGKNLTIVKRATLRGLIDDLLISQYAAGVDFEAPETEREAFAKAWENQFNTPEELEERSDYQGLTEQQRKIHLGKIWSRKRWLEKRIAPGIGITDAEVEAWYKQNKNFTEPEKIKARHIFISTVDEDDETREGLINKARERITNGEEFSEVAREISEDERTKKNGGDLNWFSKNRLPDIFSKTAFEQKTGQLGETFKTEIGWHLVEVTDRRPARASEFDDIKDEIRIHLLNQQKVEKVNELLGKLRKVAHIIVFTENLD